MSEEAGNVYMKTTVKAAGIVFTGLIVSKILSYVFRIFIARYFGPGDYGLFTLGIAVLGFFMTFAVLGTRTGVIRYIAYYRENDNERRVKGVITSGIKLVLPASLIMSFLMLISSHYIAINIFNEPELINVLLVLSFSIPFSALFVIFLSVFTGFKEIKYKIYSESIFFNFAKIALVIAFGILGFGVMGIAWAWTIAALLALLMSAHFLIKIYPVIRSKPPSIEMKKDLLSYSLPLLLTATMGFVILWIDTLMLGYFKNASDVGIYNAAMPTAQILLIFPSALIALFLPIITGLFVKKKTDELKNLYKTVTRWIFYIDFPIFLLLIFFSRQILNLLFGPEYIGGYNALIILSTGLMFRKIAQGQMVNMLQMLKKTKLILHISIIATISDVSLNYLLIPAYGITGAALATMVTYIIAFGLYYIFSFNLTKISPFSKNMLKSVIAGVLAILIVHSAARLLFVAFPIYVMAILFMAFVFIYSFILLILRGFDKEDIEMIKAIERKSGLRIEFINRILKRFM